MPKDKHKYLSAYIPETKIKESARRGNSKPSGKLDEIEETVKALQDVLTKNNRDNLDAMYNIDTDNLSSSFRRLLKSYDDGITQANASIKTWANAQEAGFQAIAQWQDTATGSMARIEGKADENSASITLLNQWKSSASESIANVQMLASQNEAKIISIAQWQSAADKDIEGLISSLASIEQSADENGASITQIVNAVGDDGKVNAASIIAAVNKSGSAVMIDADKIRMTGTTSFVSSAENDDGELEINGNSLAVNIDGSEDDGDTSLESDNGINFNYALDDEFQRMFRIYTSIDGDDGDETSRYALNIESTRFRTNDGYTAEPALKLHAFGRGSFEAMSLYFEAWHYSGYITLFANDNVRISAERAFEDLRNDGSSGYCFCSDGIYLNGDLMVPAP